MRILAFDTATRATAVAVCGTHARELEARDDPPAGQRPRHATRLMPLIVELLEDAKTDWNQLDRIAVGIGPGTFTGLRIGIATARGLALASGVPLVGVSTMRSLAEDAAPDAFDHGARSVVAVLDARRGEAYAAAWALEAGAVAGPPVLQPGAYTPGELAKRVHALAAPALAVGEGAVEFRSVLEAAGAVVPESDRSVHKVSAIPHCRLAVGLTPAAPDDVQPDYLRLPDAELARRAKQQR